MKEMIKLTRIYTGSDGQSHFGEVEIPIEDKPGIGRQSEAIKATEIVFLEKKGRLESDWHRLPQKELVILLEGEIEVEIGDGTKRRFNPGDVFLCEDTTGQGHKVRAMDRKTVVVRLA
jgi:quercetin dioxygenase-like cupin family protein